MKPCLAPRTLPLALLLALAGPLGGASEPGPAKVAPGSTGRMTDAQAADLARGALQAEDPASIREVLARLKRHTFKSSRVPERELVLYAQGVLEARLGNLSAASVALKKLEKQWPKSPFMGEAQTLLAEDAVAHARHKEAEGRLHKALASDMPAERKRRPQELLIWTLVEQGRIQEAVPIVQALRPLEPREKPSEKGLAAMVVALESLGAREEVAGARKDFHTLYPKSDLAPRVDLAWARLLGRSGDAKGAAEAFRKLIRDHPKAPESDDARLALASLLTDGSLPDAKDMPTAESLLAEVRKRGKGLPKGAGQLVELRLLVGKSLWEEALDLADQMDLAPPEARKLWLQAWKAWVAQRLEKGFPGELLARFKPGAFVALDAQARRGLVELFASQGLLEILPALLAELPAKDRGALRQAALAKAQPEAQPNAVLRLLPGKGGSPDERLLRARALAAAGRWESLPSALEGARSGPERIGVIVRLLQRPVRKGESGSQRLAEAEGWWRRAAERVDAKESLAILLADLRWQSGDAKGALALYPPQPLDEAQRGWVALMRAQAQLRLGQREAAAATLKLARDAQGFKGQRDALAKSLGAY